MDSGSKEVKRCPECGCISITKLEDSGPHLGITFHPYGEYFVCTNPKCSVERIENE